MNNVEKLITAFNDKSFGVKELGIYKQLTTEELDVIFSIEEKKLRDYLIKAYITNYDDDKFLDLETLNKDAPTIFASVWEDHLISLEPKSLLTGMVGYSFLTTNIISKLRKNIDESNINNFESQIYNTFNYLNSLIEKQKFIFEVFGSNPTSFPNEKDEVILEKMNKGTKELCNTMINKVKIVSLIWKYYISKSKSEDTSKIESQIKNINIKENYLKNVFPVFIFDKIKNVLKKDEESVFAELLNLEESPQEAIFDEDTTIDNSNKIEESESNKIFEKFKDFGKNNINNVSIHNDAKPKKRKILNKNSHKEKGNGKKMILIVLSSIIISSMLGVLLYKKNETEIVPITDTILEGIDANVTINKVEFENKDINNKNEGN